MMKASEFVAKAVDIAKNHNTVYMWGVFGAPVSESVIAGKTKQYPDWYTSVKQALFRGLIGKGYFGFDCVCLIKGILWGWTGDSSKTYGGAKYQSNGVPDTSANGMIAKCPDATTGGWDTIEPGEVVWTTGHIGIYIGDGLAVECTPKWKNNVQITAVGNIGSKAGYNTRTWKKHGHLPYVEYPVSTPKEPESVKPSAVTEVKAKGYAKSFNKSVAGTYTVTASSLNVRDGAGTDNKVLVAIPKGTKVRCYGYYTTINGVKWLYVQFTYKRVTYTGFCSGAYLKK